MFSCTALSSTRERDRCERLGRVARVLPTFAEAQRTKLLPFWQDPETMKGPKATMARRPHGPTKGREARAYEGRGGALRLSVLRVDACRSLMIHRSCLVSKVPRRLTSPTASLGHLTSKTCLRRLRTDEFSPVLELGLLLERKHFFLLQKCSCIPVCHEKRCAILNSLHGQPGEP